MTLRICQILNLERGKSINQLKLQKDSGSVSSDKDVDSAPVDFEHKALQIVPLNFSFSPK